MLESLSNLFTKGLKTVLGIFPDSPFLILETLANDTGMADTLAILNWFIPIGTFLGIMEGWLACIVVYYVWQIVIRKLSVIG